MRGLWLLGFFAGLLSISSCLPTVEMEQVVYSNNFSGLNLANFENGRLFIWQKDTIAGFYHNEEVSVDIKDLPPHNYVTITIDVLIHDSWDGNPDDGISGPDFWFMGYDDIELMKTTFSNSPCVSTFCLYQSFPNDFFRQNTPKTGAIRTDLPGLCLFGAFANYTTRYRVTKLFEHSNPEIKVFMGANLVQSNAADPICDESWSIASIEVTAIQTD